MPIQIPTMYTHTNSSQRRSAILGRPGSGVPTSDDEHMMEGVYGRIKTRLLAQALVPGQLLQIGPLADELGVSSTPVREALTRLTAERLIVCIPRKGFFVKAPTAEELRGLYCVNRTLLGSALADGAGRADEGRKQRAEIPTASHPPESRDAKQLAQCTAELFLRIAAHAGIGELTDIVHNINERLHHARLIECELIGSAHEELSKLLELDRAQHREELSRALDSYHERRLRLTSSICKELLFRHFSAGRPEPGARP